jgi:soluble lytic murein transglycosylase
VLASAAYNAGPGRARAWRADMPMEAAIYAETIPFNETRDYVKIVMSNAAYYSQQFGQTLASLKERIGVIAPRSSAADKPLDEPGG